VGSWSFVSCREFAAGQVLVDCRASVDCGEFADGRRVACLSLTIASSAEFLRLHRLYLECESAVDGMLTAEDSSQDNLSIEVLDFQLLSLGRSETVKFVARHIQNYDSLQINGCQDAEPHRCSNQSRPNHFG